SCTLIVWCRKGLHSCTNVLSPLTSQRSPRARAPPRQSREQRATHLTQDAHLPPPPASRNITACHSPAPTSSSPAEPASSAPTSSSASPPTGRTACASSTRFAATRFAPRG